MVRTLGRKKDGLTRLGKVLFVARNVIGGLSPEEMQDLFMVLLLQQVSNLSDDAIQKAFNAATKEAPSRGMNCKAMAEALEQEIIAKIPRKAA